MNLDNLTPEAKLFSQSIANVGGKKWGIVQWRRQGGERPAAPTEGMWLILACSGMPVSLSDVTCSNQASAGSGIVFIAGGDWRLSLSPTLQRHLYAPNTLSSFIYLEEKTLQNHTKMHSVIPGPVVQDLYFLEMQNLWTGAVV